MNIDKTTLKRIELLHPALRDEAKEIYYEAAKVLTNSKIQLRFSSTLRTFKEQNALYALGRTKKGRKVTNARGGQSYHNYGLAIDIVFLIDKNGDGKFETASWDTAKDWDGDNRSDWHEVVDIFKRYGWTWGGDWRFRDYPHFQKTFGKSISQLQQMQKVQKRSYLLLT